MGGQSRSSMASPAPSVRPGGQHFHAAEFHGFIDIGARAGVGLSAASFPVVFEAQDVCDQARDPERDAGVQIDGEGERLAAARRRPDGRRAIADGMADTPAAIDERRQRADHPQPDHPRDPGGHAALPSDQDQCRASPGSRDSRP